MTIDYGLRARAFMPPVFRDRWGGFPTENSAWLGAGQNEEAQVKMLKRAKEGLNSI